MKDENMLRKKVPDDAAAVAALRRGHRQHLYLEPNCSILPLVYKLFRIKSYSPVPGPVSALPHFSPYFGHYGHTLCGTVLTAGRHRLSFSLTNNRKPDSRPFWTFWTPVPHIYTPAPEYRRNALRLYPHWGQTALPFFP